MAPSMLRKGPANVAGDCVVEFRTTKGKHWTPMNDPTSEDECRKLIAQHRRAANPLGIEYRIRSVKAGATDADV